MFNVRQALKKNYALIIPDDASTTNIPGWEGANVKVLTAPCIGANFVEYLIEVNKDSKVSVSLQDRLEYVFYVLNGGGNLEFDGREYRLEDGSYGYLPPKSSWKINGSFEKPMKLIIVKKANERLNQKLPNFIIGLDKDTPEKSGPAGRAIKNFVPWSEDILYDLSWFILYFNPGVGMTHAENHLHEHGLFMLSGNSLYLLDDTWYQTKPGDFIWMAPFVPQSCEWYGEERGAYLLYSNRNRDPPV